ncbi:hypothetical protein HK101_008034 [Irineochytrium annulatum]|nr:hypothetical protein HK101_008034 [Irineochytrium annulatum]
MPIHAIPRRNSDGSDEGNFFVEEDVYADEEFEREEEHARPKERKKPSPTLRLYGMPHEEAPVPAVEPTRRKGSSMSFRNNAPPKKERSFGLPQKKNGPGQNLPYMDEIARLLSLNDTLRIKIGALEGEVKDYRIVNRRQELAIQKMDKQQDDMPQVLHGLASELKGLRSIHAGCNARIANAEKSSQAHIDENIKLQNQVMKLNKILQARHLDDNEKQKKIIDKLRDDLESKDLMIEELRRRVKHLEAERKRDAREVRELKLQHLKDLRAVKEANDETLRTAITLRVIMR